MSEIEPMTDDDRDRLEWLARHFAKGRSPDTAPDYQLELEWIRARTPERMLVLIERLAAAEADRDALLEASGWETGPLGSGRDVIWANFARLDRAEARGAWREIDDEAKSGEVVLLWMPLLNERRAASWYAPWGFWVDEKPASPQEVMYGMGEHLATHWQPLPEPPRAGEGGL